MPRASTTPSAARAPRPAEVVPCVLVYHPQHGARLSVPHHGGAHPAFAGWQVMQKIGLIPGWPLRLPPGQKLPPGFEAADPDRQKVYGMGGPRLVYAPITRRCASCGKDFGFSTAEQRHWYEELGFTIDSVATRCPPCRRSIRHHRLAAQRWAAALHAWDQAEAGFRDTAGRDAPADRIKARAALIAAAGSLVEAILSAREQGVPVREAHARRALGQLARAGADAEAAELRVRLRR